MQAARASRPERDVYERWVREHHAAVWRAARRIVRDDALASDVAQRVYVRALEHGLELAPGEDPERLLCWLACKESLTELRGRRRRAAHEERAAMRDGDAGTGASAAAERADPAEVASAAEARAWLARELGALAEDLRTVLVLRYQQGLSLREIGALLELAESSVHARVERGLGRLRKRAEQAGIAGVFVDWSLELAACESAAVAPVELGGRLLQVVPKVAPVSLTPGLAASALVLLVTAASFAAYAWTDGRDESARPAIAAPVPAIEATPLLRSLDSAVPSSNPTRAAVPASVATGGPTDANRAGAPAPPPATAARVTVRGRVLDVERRPLAGLLLAIRAESKKGSEFGLDQLHTSSNGTFASEVPAGPAYLIEFERHARVAQALRFETRAETQVDLGEIVLDQPASAFEGAWTLELGVRDERGRALAGIGVRVSPLGSANHELARRWSESTDAAGRARIRGDRQGRFEIRVGSARDGYQPVVIEQPLSWGEVPVELVLRSARTVVGRIVVPPGAEFDGVPLAAQQPGIDEWLYAEPVGTNGEFRLSGVSDRPLTLSRAQGRYSAFELRFDRPPSGELLLPLKYADDLSDVGLHRGELHGRIVDSNGAPVAVAAHNLTVVPLPENRGGDFWSDVAGSLRPFAGQISFGPEGPPPPVDRFHLTGLGNGEYAVVARVAGHALGIAGPFAIGYADSFSPADRAPILADLELVLEQGWTLDVEFERAPAALDAGDGAWLVGGTDLLPHSGFTPRPSLPLSWSGLHPRASYRVVLAGPRGARAESGAIRSTGSGERVVVRIPHWPGRP